MEITIVCIEAKQATTFLSIKHSHTHDLMQKKIIASDTSTYPTNILNILAPCSIYKFIVKVPKQQQMVGEKNKFTSHKKGFNNEGNVSSSRQWKRLLYRASHFHFYFFAIFFSWLLSRIIRSLLANNWVLDVILHSCVLYCFLPLGLDSPVAETWVFLFTTDT